MLTSTRSLVSVTEVRWQRNDEFLLTLHHIATSGGTRLALVGGNGSGKSSLLELLAGLGHPDAGKVSILGISPSDPALRRRLGVQTPLATYNSLLKVRDLVDLHCALHHDIDTMVGETLGIAELRDRLVGTLSQGQRRRLDLYLAFAHAPDLMLLDEPTAGLDAQRRLGFLLLCDRAIARGAGIVTATHDPGEVEAADEVCWFRKGRLHTTASPEALLRDVVGSFTGEIIYAGDAEADEAATRLGEAGARTVRRHGAKLRVAGDGEASAAFEALLATSNPVRTSRGVAGVDDLLEAVSREDRS